MKLACSNYTVFVCSNYLTGFSSVTEEARLLRNDRLSLR